MTNLFPAFGLLSACAPPCDLEPTVVHDDGHAEIAAAVEQHVLEFLDWTDTRCLAEVEVTESAPEEGEHDRTRHGWTLSVHPDVVTPFQVAWHLCDMVRVEERALARAPRDLFQSEDGSRTSRFLDLCAAGPPDRAFVEQSLVCGLPPLTAEETWIQDVVYDQRAPMVAPDLPVVVEDPVTVPRSPDVIVRMYTAGAEGLHVLANDLVTGASGLELRTPAGTTYEHDLPELADRSPRRIAADLERAVFLVAQDNDLAWWYDLMVVDRATGATTWVPVPEQLRDLSYADAGVVIGDELVLDGTGNGIPGQLHAISTVDGRVRAIDLPAPEDPQLTSAPRSFWSDPTRPGHLLVSYVFQHYERVDYAYDSVSTTWSLDRFVARLDVETGAWETLLHTNPWSFDPSVWPLGVTGDGRVVLRIDLEDDAALLGTLDGETGELRVSGSVCLGERDWPAVVIGDAVHQVLGFDDADVWTAYRLGP